MPNKDKKYRSGYRPKYQANEKKVASAPQKSDTVQMEDIFSSATREKQIQSQKISDGSQPKTDIEPMDIMSTAPVKKSKKRLAAKIAVLVFSLLFIVSGSLLIYGDTILNKINYVQDASEASVAVASYVANNVTVNSTVLGQASMRNGLYHDDAIKNVLIIGVDDYRKGDVGRSDSMLLVSIDTRHHKLKAISFLRDLYVNIPGCSEANRINVAYSLGRAPLTVQTIESNFGIDIDNYVTVSYIAFWNIIDKLGGISLTITDDEAKLINKYSHESKLKDLTAGTQLLTGCQASYYTRIRILDTDFGRTERQRKVFTSLINRFKNSDLNVIRKTMSDVLPLVTTNMDKNRVVDLITNSLTYMQYPISQYHVPADNTFSFEMVTIGGVAGNDVIVADMKKNSLSAAKFIYEDDFSFPADDTFSSSSTSDN